MILKTICYSSIQQTNNKTIEVRYIFIYLIEDSHKCPVSHKSDIQTWTLPLLVHWHIKIHMPLRKQCVAHYITQKYTRRQYRATYMKDMDWCVMYFFFVINWTTTVCKYNLHYSNICVTFTYTKHIYFIKIPYSSVNSARCVYKSTYLPRWALYHHTFVSHWHTDTQ